MNFKTLKINKNYEKSRFSAAQTPELGHEPAQKKAPSSVQEFLGGIAPNILQCLCVLFVGVDTTRNKYRVLHISVQGVCLFVFFFFFNKHVGIYRETLETQESCIKRAPAKRVNV